MVSCLFGFTFSGNANFVTGLYHARRFCDRFFAFNCCKADQYNVAKFSERTSFGAVAFPAMYDTFKNGLF